ncbi:MAG: PHP-associated domain-containing protein [Candidatus Woesearchaeota archaeon]
MKPTLKKILSLISASLIGLYSVGMCSYELSKRGLSRPERRDYEVAISLHNHTPFLKSADAGLEELVECAFKQDIDILALTDANSEENFYHLKDKYSGVLSGYNVQDLGSVLKISKISDSEDVIYILAGYEFHRPSGHILIIGQNCRINLDCKSTSEDAILAGKNSGAIVIIPHPFVTSWNVGGVGEDKLKELYNEVDAIESFNAQAVCIYPIIADLHQANLKASNFCEELKVPGVSNSDSHIASHVGLSYILVDKSKIDFSSGEAIVNSLRNVIRSGEFRNYERYASWFETVRWAAISRILSRKR